MKLHNNTEYNQLELSEKIAQLVTVLIHSPSTWLALAFRRRRWLWRINDMFTGLCQSLDVCLSTLNIRLKVLHTTQHGITIHPKKS